MVENHLRILKDKMETRFQFLEGIYLPGYMGLKTEDYDKRSGVFDFTPTEPPLAHIVHNTFISSSMYVLQLIFQSLRLVS